MDQIRKRLQELGIEDDEQLWVALREKDEQHLVALREKDEQISHLTATPFCSIRQALSGSWQP